MAVHVSIDPGDEPVISTPLKSLRARRQEIVDGLVLDLKVPRWEEPEIYVRYRPISAARSQEILKARENKTKDWVVLASADHLASSCVGVYGVLNGNTDQKFSLALGPDGVPSGEPTQPEQCTKFDDRLAEALGLPPFPQSNAVSVVRSVYLTDGDIIAAGGTLTEWSSKADEDADEAFLRS